MMRWAHKHLTNCKFGFANVQFCADESGVVSMPDSGDDPPKEVQDKMEGHAAFHKVHVAASVAATPEPPAPPEEGPKEIVAEVGAMEVKISAGPDGELGTSDDEISIKPKSRPKTKSKTRKGRSKK